MLFSPQPEGTQSRGNKKGGADRLKMNNRFEALARKFITDIAANLLFSCGSFGSIKSNAAGSAEAADNLMKLFTPYSRTKNYFYKTNIKHSKLQTIKSCYLQNFSLIP